MTTRFHINVPKRNDINELYGQVEDAYQTKLFTCGIITLIHSVLSHAIDCISHGEIGTLYLWLRQKLMQF